MTSVLQLPKLALQLIEQEPSAQPGVPFALEQEVPQAPQLPTLVCVLTSQPLAATPSQLPNPGLQVPSVHDPDAHDSEALAKSQIAPQEPQLVSVVRLVSQPFAALPSQFPNPGLQLPIWHAPPKQDAPALVKLHTVVQLPQWVGLFVVLVSQPLPTLPSQLPKPAEHEMEQLPAEQVGVPLADEHAAPHPPQLAVLVLMFVSQPFALLPSQLPKPASHPTSWQVPLAHDSVAFAMSQATPHAPQLVSVFRLVSHPLVGSPSQFANPEAQVGAQTPPVHVVVPLALEQTVPHEPQFAALVLRFASHPSAASPSQLPKPAAQVRMPHVPDEHVAVAFKSEQTVPQLPQFAVLL